VSKKCKTPPTKVVALLHDIVEDTDVTLEMLEELGFSEFIIKAVSCLTHQEGESYEDYVRRAAKNPISREVKLADLEDNMDIRRLEFITEEDLSRLDKYRIAWKYLNDYNK
jgi:(p)ppGpp synthase/HD superfamily hydrolase